MKETHRRRWRRRMAGLLIVLAIPLVIAGGYLFWRDHRPQPENTQVELFNGITYIRDVRQQPRPLVVRSRVSS